MTLQNRVRPTGEIVAEDWRGEWMGNRGILHDTAKRLGTSRWKHPHWIICRLAFKGRKREPMRSGRYYTELFFFDEPMALAAGHRPCAECRREAYLSFRGAWEHALGRVGGAADMDRALHRARLQDRTRAQRRITSDPAGLPDGAIILIDTTPALLWGGMAHPWTPDGYQRPEALPRGTVEVCTPAPTLAALKAGYRPEPRVGFIEALERHRP